LIYVDMTHLVTNSHSLFYWLDCACVWVCVWKLAMHSDFLLWSGWLYLSRSCLYHIQTRCI